MSRRALKWVKQDGRAAFVSGFVWPLPRRVDDVWLPGEWVEVTGELRECANGVHALRPDNVENTLYAPGRQGVLYVIELDGEIVEGKDKLLARRGRLLRPALSVQFAMQPGLPKLAREVLKWSAAAVAWPDALSACIQLGVPSGAYRLVSPMSHLVRIAKAQAEKVVVPFERVVAEELAA